MMPANGCLEANSLSFFVPKDFLLLTVFEYGPMIYEMKKSSREKEMKVKSECLKGDQIDSPNIGSFPNFLFEKVGSLSS